MSRRTEQSFFKGRCPNGQNKTKQKLCEEMLISGHKGNANQNHIKIPPSSSLWLE
jgi:hypothetical protein